MNPNLRVTPKIKLTLAAVAALAWLAQPSQAADAASTDTVAIYAAGSLRGAMTDLAQGWEKCGATAGKTTLTFGASGLLRDRIAGGEKAQVFASANMSHPQLLQTGGQADAVVAFARLRGCRC
jgi:ABC-type molybdate transport system substrate-binding protein